MKEPTTRQKKILDYIRDFISEHDYPPSIRDIQLGCNVSSTSVVDYNLRALERLGYLRRDREVSRAIELTAAGGKRPRTMAVPIVGQIAAGQPIPVPDTDEFPNPDYSDAIEITEEMTGGREGLFALRVKGVSMIDALINDGDIVVMEPAKTADEGDMVAVWLKEEEEVTLKHFHHEGDKIRLQPANSTMPPIYTAPDNVEIQGKVVCAIRPMR